MRIVKANKNRHFIHFFPLWMSTETMRKFQIPLLTSYVVVGSFVGIFIRYLTFYFDSFTLNFYRFLAGSLSLCLISFLFFRNDLTKILRSYHQLAQIIALAGVFTLSGFLYVKGLSYTSATMGSLTEILTLLITITLVSLTFRDEREIINEKYFIFGLILAIFGVIGLSISRGGATIEYSVGVYYLLISAILASCTAPLLKKLILALNPLCLASLSAAFASIFFFIGALLWGDLMKITRVSFFAQVILFSSGVYGLMAGLALHNIYIKNFGMSRVSTVSLSTPIFTGIFAYLFLKEALSPQQMIFAAILMGGCFLAIRKKHKKE